MCVNALASVSQSGVAASLCPRTPKGLATARTPQAEFLPMAPCAESLRNFMFLITVTKE